jgi:Plasmid encoded RepA protein
MGQIHQLIELHGIEAAKSDAQDKLDRQCVDAAVGVMFDEQQRIGVMHAGFSMTALPHRDTGETKWVRQGGGVKLLVESGSDSDMTPIGIPFGSIARMILLYLQTEAVKTRSREIELGRSMNRWLATMGIDNGGKTYKLVREQAKRLSLCRLTFYKEAPGNVTQIMNGSFVRDAIIPTRADDQLPLWREAVTLDERFYMSLMEHKLPLREAAIRQIGTRSMAIDIYIWLAYRLHSLAKPTPVSWTALCNQFGAGFIHSWHFKKSFQAPLQLALAAYPEAKVAIDEKGLVLYPSEPAVPKESVSYSMLGRLGGSTRSASIG